MISESFLADQTGYVCTSISLFACLSLAGLPGIQPPDFFAILCNNDKEHINHWFGGRIGLMIWQKFLVCHAKTEKSVVHVKIIQKRCKHVDNTEI